MSESKSNKGKWAAVVTIVTALLTSLTSIVITIIASGNFEEESRAHGHKVEQSATGAAVDVLWLKDRVRQLEQDVAVARALRKVAEDRIDRVEARLFRRGSHGRPTTVARPINLDEVEAKAKEEVKKTRPPKPKPDDERVQQILKIYLEKKR